MAVYVLNGFLMALLTVSILAVGAMTYYLYRLGHKFKGLLAEIAAAHNSLTDSQKNLDTKFQTLHQRVEFMTQQKTGKPNIRPLG